MGLSEARPRRFFTKKPNQGNEMKLLAALLVCSLPVASQRTAVSEGPLHTVTLPAPVPSTTIDGASGPADGGTATPTVFPETLDGMFFQGGYSSMDAMGNIIPKESGEWILLFLGGKYYGMILGSCGEVSFEVRHGGTYRYHADLGLIDIQTGNLFGVSGNSRFELAPNSHTFSFRFRVHDAANPCYSLQGVATMAPAQLPSFVRRMLAPAPGQPAKPESVDPTKPSDPVKTPSMSPARW